MIILLNLFILESESRSITKLATFMPTAEFVQHVVPFHDQYQRSHTIWSPDSRFFVLNSITSEGKPGVFVVSVSEDGLQPRLIALGTLPFWAPEQKY
jgi:hypothetical protein